MADAHRRVTNFGPESASVLMEGAILEAMAPVRHERETLHYYKPIQKSGAAAVNEAAGPGDLVVPEEISIVDAAAASFGDTPLLEVVIGLDDRVKLRNTLIADPPWRQICALRIQSTTGKMYVGTGWFIGPRVLVTAGHCVYLHNEGGWPASIEILVGLHGSRSLERTTSQRFGSVAGWVSNKSRDHDYGVIFLDDDKPGKRVGNFEVRTASDVELKGVNARISGYPADRDRAQFQYYHQRPIKSATASRIEYDIDTYGGQSGSPVWCDTVEDGIVAVGIHTTGSATGNSATRVIAPVMNNLRAWLGLGSGTSIQRSKGSDAVRGIDRSEGGAAQPPPSRPQNPPPAGTPQDLRRAIEVAAAHREELLQIPGVLDVRGGYKFASGRITAQAAVVIAVSRKRPKVPRNEIVPAKLDGVPTDVEVADPYQRLAAAGGTESASVFPPRLLIDEFQQTEDESVSLDEVEEAAPDISYSPPPGVKLKAVSGTMKLTCHVSPDAGWTTLGPFLSGASSSITLGMYDFSAPHIYRSVRTLLRDSTRVTWQQTLDPKESLPEDGDADSNKAGDLHESSIINGLKRVAGTRFSSEFASTGKDGTFASAYHIKVAVRDHTDFWLSSGNWQSSNQPDIDFLVPGADLKLISRYNREWHVLVEGSAELARCFEAFLKHDFKTARTARVGEAAAVPGPDLLLPVDEAFEIEKKARALRAFKPKTITARVDVQPILTPDNYVEHVLKLLRQRPESRLYFQNQSLNPVLKPTPEFREMMELLAGYSRDKKLDVRFIFRNIGPIRKKLESLQAAGFNMKRVKTQSGCHTKGIIIDGETILLGSHNFTNQGVQYNRDASLLIRSKPVAAYFEKVFEHDWEELARPTIREEATPIPLVGMEAVDPAVMEGRRVTWASYEED